jgi:HSP20 family protein
MSSACPARESRRVMLVAQTAGCDGLRRIPPSAPKGGSQTAMAMERWDPMHEMQSMREAMERFFDEFWRHPQNALAGEWSGATPVDMSETDSKFVVRATIPGLRPEDIQVSAHGDRLTIQAARQADEERQGERYLVQERRSAAFYRLLTLPAPVNSDTAEASYTQGVLTITLPKAQPGKSAQIPVRGSDTVKVIEPGETPPKGT